MNYWSRKDELAKKAVIHTKEMSKKYKSEIALSIENTKFYDRQPDLETSGDLPKIEIVDLDSVSAIHKYSSENMAVLNFASYKFPGGGFIRGSSAQEEALCQHSYLYNVISDFDKTVYEWNRNNLNKGMYLNRGLYSPDIMFDDRTKCSVITVPAPNKSVMLKYGNFTEEENAKALINRVKFIIDIATENNVKTLILGAFGCGVFKQDPVEVATLFKKVLRGSSFDKVVFAIPRGTNYNAFKRVFKA